MVDEDGKAYLERYGKSTKGSGWYSFDQNGVHFVGLVNVANLKAGGLGDLGADQLEWLEDDLRPLSASALQLSSSPTSRSGRSIQNGAGAPTTWPGARYLKRFGSVTVLNGHIHHHAEGRGQRHLPHRPLDRIPAAGAGHAPSPGPMRSPGRKAARVLGITTVTFKQGKSALAITDTALADARLQAPRARDQSDRGAEAGTRMTGDPPSTRRVTTIRCSFGLGAVSVTRRCPMWPQANWRSSRRAGAVAPQASSEPMVMIATSAKGRSQCQRCPAAISAKAR